MKKYEQPKITVTSLFAEDDVCKGGEVEISVGDLGWDTFDDE